ncbi:hypothetical protein PVAND_007783 [Polypedilum vanderplanki]|uniref:Sialin n=1 Tax=Polypedilum vanderplanki TaxID=319348 RepID=A0A9J6C7N6_POLVA|nr:hypothetical protein PVAND_007783 [Polypedilum vanderplanki]
MENSIIETAPFWKKKRYLVVLLAFFGFFNVYALRVNLSVAIVSMTEVREIHHENNTVIEEQYFNWSSKQKGLVLSSFFYGYITTQFMGGYLASRYGGNLIFGIGIGVTAFFTLLTPLAASWNIYALVAVRVIEGIFEGMTFPCCYHIWSKWAPPLERSRMANFAMAGNYVGTVVGMPLSGIFATYIGWQSVFYIFGTIGIVWLIMWILIVKASPEADSRISKIERDYIIASIGRNANEKPPNFNEIPWKDIFMSKAVWAIIVAFFCESWGFFTMFTELPSFFKDLLDFDISKSAILSALPYLALTILLFFSGFIADWFQVKSILTTTQVRRYFTCISFLSQTIFMILAAFILHRVYSVIFLTIGIGLGAFSLSGFAINHLDIAPQYASILMGIGNTFGTIPGMVSPLLTGYIVTKSTESEWRIVFYITAALYISGCIFYWFFSSGKVQAWAEKKNEIKNKI